LYDPQYRNWVNRQPKRVGRGSGGDGPERVIGFSGVIPVASTSGVSGRSGGANVGELRNDD